MTNFDLTPLLRSTVGFDRMTRLLENSLTAGEANYPPYNILKKDENNYEITVAVAGFSEDDIEITAKDNMLIVKSLEKPHSELEEGQSYLHRGIAERHFERHFQLADYIRVENARMENGLLSIGLVRELPERMKPRTIQIENGSKRSLLGGKKSDKKAA